MFSGSVWSYEPRPGKSCKRCKRRLWTCWGLFDPNIQYFLLRMEKEELKIDNWGWIKEIWGRSTENAGWRAMDWGYALKVWGIDHATPTFDIFISVHPLSWIALFWGLFKALNFLLEDDSQLFPGLYEHTAKRIKLICGREDMVLAPFDRQSPL